MCWRHSACRKCVAAEWRVYVCGCGVWIEHQPSRVEMGKKASEMREKKRSTCTYWGHSFIRPYNRTSYSALRVCTSLDGLWVYLCSTSITGGTAKMATYVVPSNLILYILRNAVRGFWIYSGQFTWAAEIQFSFFPVAFVSSFVVDAHCLTYTHTHTGHTGIIHRCSLPTAERSLSRVSIWFYATTQTLAAPLGVCVFVFQPLLSYSPLRNIIISRSVSDQSLLHKCIRKEIHYYSTSSE